MHVSNDKYLEGIKLYWGSKDYKNDSQGEEAPTNEAINQKIHPFFLIRYQMKDRYYDKN